MSAAVASAIAQAGPGVDSAAPDVEVVDQEAMSDAELRMVREYLGLSGEALAALLGVADRTVRRWEAGTHTIPTWARQQIEALEDAAAELVEATVVALHDHLDPSEVALVLYRSDAHYWAAHPAMRPHPASWHRAINARVAQEIPGLAVA